MGNVVMEIYLPRNQCGIAELETNLFAAKQYFSKNKSNIKVKVEISKFKAEQTNQLAQALTKMGMGEKFEKTADFSGIDGSKELLVSKVFHKVMIEVNEEGTEAAAATGMMMGITCIEEPPPQFRADHPCIFVLRDTATDMPLFIGKVTSPSI